MKLIGHFINGTSTNGKSEGRGAVFNPATGEQIGMTMLASVREVEDAVAAARAAAPAWAEMALGERTRIMFQIRDVLIRHTDELAGLITEENGKTIEDSKGEIRRGLETVEFACGISQLLKGEYSVNVSAGINTHSIRQPLGVVACITPFNFPVMVPLWMLANALASGNTVVLKPSEKAPSATIRLAELLHEAGLPDGVLNVVNGDRLAVETLLGHQDVNGISFIGSTPVARHVYEQGTKSGKRVQALGGAKNHMVVMPDADLDMAADAAVAAAFGAAGERCMAISVIVAVDGVADELLPRIQDRMQKLNIGPGNQIGVEMGPLITREHRDRVASYLDAGERAGAKLVVDGRQDAVSAGPGFFLGASLIDHVTAEMSVYQDEIFGPVLSVIRVDDYNQALSLVNSNPFGNGTAIFTRDGGTARRFETECQIGMVGINVSIPTPVATYSFGGWKASLFGHAHMYGPDGINFFTRQKVVTSRW